MQYSTPKIPKITSNKLKTIKISVTEVKKLLLKVDVKKALGPDNISPYVIKKCAY